MPAGVSWPKYLTFSVAAFLSMLAGSEVVHRLYLPLNDLNDYVKREKETITK